MSEETEMAAGPSRYDNPLVTPPPEMLQIHFSLLGAVNALVTIASFILILGILRSKNVRKHAFNLYVLFMAIPDFIAALLCLITCAMGAYHSHYYSEWMCKFQSFYLTATFATNAWMNGLIVHEVYKLIRYSHARRRYFPPTRQQVFCRVSIVYTYGLVWGLLASVIPGVPVKPQPFYGLVCMPMEYDLPSTLFFYMAYVPGIMVLPMMYSLGVMIHILRKGLLPKSGRNRVISVYLLRLIALYFLFWLPCLLLKVIGNWIKIDPWYPWAGSVLSHFQGLFSSLCAIATSDPIRRQVLMVLGCGRFFTDADGASSKQKHPIGNEDPTDSNPSWLSSHLPRRWSSSRRKSRISESARTSTASTSENHPDVQESQNGEVEQEKAGDDLEAADPQPTSP